MRSGGPAETTGVQSPNIPWVKDSKMLRLQTPIILIVLWKVSMFLRFHHMILCC